MGSPFCLCCMRYGKRMVDLLFESIPFDLSAAHNWAKRGHSDDEATVTIYNTAIGRGEAQ